MTVFTTSSSSRITHSTLALLITLLCAFANTAYASISVTEPTSADTFDGGKQVTTTWVDDGKAPLLSALGNCDITLNYDSGHQTYLAQVIGQGINVNTQHGLTFDVDAAAGPNSTDYYITFTCPSANFQTFSASFSLFEMTGVAGSSVPSDTSFTVASTTSSSAPSSSGSASSSLSSAPSSGSGSSSASSSSTSNGIVATSTVVVSGSSSSSNSSGSGSSSSSSSGGPVSPAAPSFSFLPSSASGSSSSSASSAFITSITSQTTLFIPPPSSSSTGPSTSTVFTSPSTSASSAASALKVGFSLRNGNLGALAVVLVGIVAGGFVL